MIMRHVYRRRLPRVLNALALVLAGAILFTPKLDTWQTPDLVLMFFSPQLSDMAAG